MRVGRPAPGIFAGDYKPPQEWTCFTIRLQRVKQHTNRVIGSLTDAELQWIGRCIVAECKRRARDKTPGVHAESVSV